MVRNPRWTGCGQLRNGLTSIVNFAKHVKQKRIDVEVQRLVIEEQLGDVAQVLAVQPLLQAVHLEHFASKNGI